ncbi:bifunctional 2-polyprenyl-6-hydroxyphenol methylase/3-demethylubiquinol 3-O-methyltransferase UbiG [uncultured Tateyamaria sp.]|nr:class I SAM-dependent methyltransferase [uncultured Tateyamaria sp.]
MLTIRRDDGHVDRHDPDLYFAPAPFAHEIPLLEKVDGPVLDVGCGAGRTLLWLEKRGVSATGVDLSRGAVEVARMRGCQDVRFGDIMDPELPFQGNTFRTAVVFGNNIGIGGTYAGAETLLRRLAHVVAPGGQLLVTGLDIANTDQEHHLAYHQHNIERGRPRGEIAMRFEYRGAVEDWIQWFHPEPDELERMAKATGWIVEDIGPAVGPFYTGVFYRVE